MTDRNELERLLAAATEGPWGIAAYYTGTGPVQVAVMMMLERKGHD